jgi:hypothetical protein
MAKKVNRCRRTQYCIIPLDSHMGFRHPRIIYWIAFLLEEGNPSHTQTLPSN